MEKTRREREREREREKRERKKERWEEKKARAFQNCCKTSVVVTLQQPDDINKTAVLNNVQQCLVA